MNLIGYNKKIKVLFYVMVVFLFLGFLSLYIADSIKMKYSVVHDNFVNHIIDDQTLTNKDIRQIGKSIKAINDEFHTMEYVAIFNIKNESNELQFLHTSLNKAEYLIPINAKKKGKFLTELFCVTEGFKVGDYYVVHNYFPEWYYLIPVGLFSIGGILLITWLLIQIRYVFKARLLKLKFQ